MVSLASVGRIRPDLRFPRLKSCSAVVTVIHSKLKHQRGLVQRVGHINNAVTVEFWLEQVSKILSWSTRAILVVTKPFTQ